MKPARAVPFVFVLGACGATVPPATDATGAPPPTATEVPSASPAGAAVPADDPSVSIGAPLPASPATSQCDGHPGANLATGGTATASDVSERALDGPQAAFDDHTGTRWVAPKNPHAWLAYELRDGQAAVATQYALSPVPAGTVGTDPVSWKLEAANDAAGPWTVLHEHKAQRFVNRHATVWFSFQNATPYKRYRLAITENGGGAGVELAELALFGPGNPTFSVDNLLRGAHKNEFQYGRHWQHGKDSEFVPPKYGSSSSWNKHADDSLTFTFVGSQVSLYGVRFPGHGIAAISIDGGPETMVDFYGAAAGDTLFYTSPMLCPPKQHVLHVRTTGDKNPKASDTYVSIDRVKIVP